MVGFFGGPFPDQNDHIRCIAYGPTELGFLELIQIMVGSFVSGWWFGTWLLCPPYIGNFIIPTDELHHFSEGWLNEFNHQPGFWWAPDGGKNHHQPALAPLKAATFGQADGKSAATVAPVLPSQRAGVIIYLQHILLQYAHINIIYIYALMHIAYHI